MSPTPTETAPSSLLCTHESLHTRIEDAAEGIEQHVDPNRVLREARRTLYPGAATEEVDEALVLAARTLIERDPAYSTLAARLTLQRLYREVFDEHRTEDQISTSADPLYRDHFRPYLTQGVEAGRLDPALLEFDVETLARRLRPERDRRLTLHSVQTLADRYLIRSADGKRLELPQWLWMRVAMGLALAEPPAERERRAARFYEVMSRSLFSPSTPTLFNAGTTRPQLASCFLTTVQDDLGEIFKAYRDDALLSKWSGGLGNDWTNVRAMGAHIRGTNGESQGVVPFLKIANDTAVAVNQGGKRQGAICAYLEAWHLDVEDFLHLRKNTGGERRRTHDMHTAVWVPDLFMQRVEEDGSWTLFSPDEVPGLHHTYGAAFRSKYEDYERRFEAGEMVLGRQVRARALWRRMLEMLYETGHPWLTFKDPCNVRSPQDHAGVVHSSNLCTEITLNTSADETAVCNLGSVNLPAHLEDGGLDFDRLRATVRTAMRMLDNVIDLNLYPIPEAEHSNRRHRPVGLGIMGFQDALHELGVGYDSEEAVEFADRSTEAVSWCAIRASAELAAERGPYPSVEGSKWDRGLLPIDTIDLLERERGQAVEMDRTTNLDWEPVRAAIAEHGMRNSNVMAIAPTATISNIHGVSASIDPTYKNLFVKSNLSGEFTEVSEYLVRELQVRGLWDEEMVDALKRQDGSVREIDRVPKELKRRFPTAFEIPPERLIECASRRQKWVDQSQSLNLYLDQPSGQKLSEMYRRAWRRGLKTTYYLRTLGASGIEKSTVDVNRDGLQPEWMSSESPSARVDVERDSCELPRDEHSVDGDCEACQ